MTFPIMGGGFNATAPAFPVQRSIRLRAAAPAYFNRTFTTPTNQAKWTWSGWVKRGLLGSLQRLLSSGTSASDTTTTTVYFSASDTLAFSGGTTNFRISNQVFRDPSAWYHIVIAVDTTLTEASKILIYVNGVQITFATTNAITTCAFNSAQTAYIGQFSSSQYLDGYLTEVYFIDGQQLTPTSFGSYNIGTGVWQPIKYTGTYGTNGFYLNFQDNSGQTTSSNVGIGKDSSGNGNYWVSNGITLTPTTSASYDSMLDVPTNTSPTNANFAVLNPLVNANLSSGNLQVTGSGAGEFHPATILLPTTGKWYCEMSSTAYNASTIVGWFGVANRSGTNFSGLLSRVTGAGGGFFQNDVSILSTNIGALNTIVGVAVDRGANTVTIYLNGVAQSTVPTMATGVDLYLSYGTYTSGTGWVNFGQRPFSYPLAGFNPLCTYNLPTPLIPSGVLYMAATTYTGTGAAQSIVNTTNNPLVSPFSNNPNAVAMQPDLVWVKKRNGVDNHELTDSVRGNSLRLASNTTDQQSAGGISIASNGFSLSGSPVYGTDNESGFTYVGWQWKGGGTAVTNTAGSISAQVSANTTSKFSVVTYTGTGVAGTIGHGLNAAPKMIIVKWRTGGTTESWAVYSESIGATKYFSLNTSNQAATATSVWNDTAPSTTVFSVGTDTWVNASTRTYVAYCWAEVPGYSKFGTYVGNSSTSNFVYCGFRPRFIMTKAVGTANGSTVSTFWTIWDTSRSTYNASLAQLYPNSNIGQDAETSGIDILSNGFNLKRNSEYANWSGTTYIFVAFAENPFNYSLAR